MPLKLKFPEGPLTEPLPPLRLGIIASEGENETKIERRVSLEYEKLELLAAHFGIQPGPSAWYQLSLHLARFLVPGLNEAKPKGRPTKWGMVERALLVVEIERRTSQGLTQEQAARAIAKLEPWQSFVTSWSYGKATTGPDPAEALRQEYKKGKNHFFADVARDAFRLHEYEGTLDKWQDFVISAIESPTLE